MGSGVQAQLIFLPSKRIPFACCDPGMGPTGPERGKGGTGGKGQRKSKSALGADKP